MRLATFNINGIKARAGALTRWLDEAQPDVAVLQEIKSTDETFPRELIEERGYNLETHGQKGFNGVAILSKTQLSDVTSEQHRRRQQRRQQDKQRQKGHIAAQGNHEIGHGVAPKG